MALRQQLREGETLAVHPVHVLAENRWRALRDGLDAELVDPASGLVEPARDRIARLLLELEPHAKRIGCGPELARAWPLLAANGAERQRAVAGERGLDGLLEWLAVQTEFASGGLTPQPLGVVDSLAAVATATPSRSSVESPGTG